MHTDKTIEYLKEIKACKGEIEVHKDHISNIKSSIKKLEFKILKEEYDIEKGNVVVIKHSKNTILAGIVNKVHMTIFYDNEIWITVDILSIRKKDNQIGTGIRTFRDKDKILKRYESYETYLQGVEI